MPSAIPDPVRFEAVYRAHHAAITRFVQRRVDPDTVDDVVSDTFAVAWRRLGSVPADPLPWLFVVARNLINAEYRSVASHEEKVARLRHEFRDEERHSPDVGDAIAARDLVLHALDRLNEPDREVLRLIAWDGLDHATAAHVLGTSRVAFSMRLSRARRRLRLLLAELEQSTAPTQPIHIPGKQS